MQGGFVTQPTYVDVSTAGTPLDFLPQGTPVHVTLTSDIPAVVAGGGDGVLTARVSAPNTLRFRSKGFPDGAYDVLVTVFD